MRATRLTQIIFSHKEENYNPTASDINCKQNPVVCDLVLTVLDLHTAVLSK